MLELTLDKASTDNVQKQLDILRANGEYGALKAIYMVAEKIVNEAKMRLRGQKHIVTSRLRNSIFVKTPVKTSKSYTDKEGRNFTAELFSVSLTDDQCAVGTNVEYAEKIENMDPFIAWAAYSADVNNSVKDDMQKSMENVLKFGTGILPANKRDAWQEVYDTVNND